MPEAAVGRSHRAFGSIGGRAHGASLAFFEWRALWLGMSRVATRITRIPGVVAVVVDAVAAIRKGRRTSMRPSASCRKASTACLAATRSVAMAPAVAAAADAAV